MAKKKPYKKPQVKKYGSVRDLTKAMSTGPDADGMAGLFTMCITPAPQIEEHRLLITDEVSQNGFKSAIQKAVKPGDVVLDLGTGSGIHAFFACQAGAKKVYAIDAASILEVARNAAVKNNFNDRIEFISGQAEEIDLPEKVDVIITNIGFLNTIQTLPIVAKKHLKDGGKLIPSDLELKFTIVSAPKEFSERIQFWDQNRYGLDFSAFREMATNHPLYTVYNPEQLLGTAGSLGKLNMLKLTDDFMETKIEVVVQKDGVTHGLGGWYNFWADDNLLMTTEPPLKMDKLIWSEIFLPFDQPLNVQKGDVLTFEIGMYSRGSYSGPIWRWQGWRNDQIIADQCSFYATPLAPEYLAKLN